MSTFTYEKVGQYGSEVVARIVADKGKVKAKDGNFYVIDINYRFFVLDNLNY